MAKRKKSKTRQSSAAKPRPNHPGTPGSAPPVSTSPPPPKPPQGLPLGESSHHDDDAPLAATSSDDTVHPTGNIVGVHLWQVRWVRDITVIVAAIVLFAVIYHIREVVLPVLIGLGLAYVAHPLVTLLHRRWNIKRITSSSLMATAAVVLFCTLLIALLPPIIDQAAGLRRNFDSYFDTVVNMLRLTPEADEPQPAPGGPSTAPDAKPDVTPDAVAPTVDSGEGDRDKTAQPDTNPTNTATVEQPPAPDTTGSSTTPARPSVTKSAAELVSHEWKSFGGIVLKSLDIGVQAISIVTYLFGATFIAMFCFVFFSWKFEGILKWFDQFIPRRHRKRTLEILGRMDRSVAGFVRGRLIQSAIMAVLLSFAWWLCGVPYWLLLGVLGGLFNVVPFAASLICVAAVGLSLAYQAQAPEFNWLVPIMALATYGSIQFIDNHFVEPYVQGKATDLDPLTVLLAVIVGGALAGLLGIIIAIPAAACLKILAQELIFPNLKTWIAKWE